MLFSEPALTARRVSDGGDIEVTDGDVRIFFRSDKTVKLTQRRDARYGHWSRGQVTQAVMRRAEALASFVD